jgi:hypothetical protein
MDLGVLTRFIDPTGKCSDPRMVNAVAAYCGITLASNAEIIEARALAASTISDAVVSIDLMQAVQDITQCGIFVVRERGVITGLTGFVPLRDPGIQALRAGTFDSLNIDLDHVWRPREIPAGGYAWGFAATNDRAAGRVVKGSVAVRETLFWALPAYTRAATADGVRVILGSLGFERVPGDPTLTYSGPRAAALQGFAPGASA